MPDPALRVERRDRFSPQIFAARRTDRFDGNRAVNLGDDGGHHIAALIDLGDQSVGIEQMIERHSAASPVGRSQPRDAVIGQHEGQALLAQSNCDDAAGISILRRRCRRINCNDDTLEIRDLRRPHSVDRIALEERIGAIIDQFAVEFLSTKPLFHDVVDAFLEFIGDAPLVIHNASFDISFINAELDRIKRPAIPRERLVDTLLLARRKHPGVSNRLDDLCSRYAIDNSRRTKHGALLDAELLAEVYVDLVGARQSQLLLASDTDEGRASQAADAPRRQRLVPLSPRISDAEREAHRAFIATLGDKAIWNEYLPAPAAAQA